MNAIARHLAPAFVPVGEAFVDEIDLIDMLHALTGWAGALADGATAGCILVGERGRPGFAIGTDPVVDRLEHLQAGTREGPGPETLRSGLGSVSGDLVATGDRWPHFTGSAMAAGFQAAHTFPLRWGQVLIGTVTVYVPAGGDAFGNRYGAMMQGVVDMASWGLLRHRPGEDTRLLAAQRLQWALSRRTLVDQAIGVLAEAFGLSTGDAFARLRDHARHDDRSLAQVADIVVNRIGAAAHFSTPLL